MAAKNKSKSARDEFAPSVKRKLADRAGLECSCPTCNNKTKGPEANGQGVAGLGIAAHIVSASPDSGPRADPNMATLDRRSFDNGIWLCSNHATIIDSDRMRYSPELLRRWKSDHEEKIALQVSGVWVGNGILKEARFSNIGPFLGEQHISFAPRTLLLGNNGTGKSVLCDFLSLLGRYRFAEDRLPLLHNDRPWLEMVTYSNTQRKWRFDFSDSVSIKLEDAPFPYVFSGFHLIYCRDPFREPKYDNFEQVPEEKMNSDLLEALGEYIGFSPEETRAVICTFASRRPRFLDEIRINDTGRLEGKTNCTKGHWCEYQSLSCAEQQLLLLDLVLRAARFSGETTPTILLIDQGVLHTLDDSWKKQVVEELGTDSGPYQTILSMYNWPNGHDFSNWRVWRIERSKFSGEFSVIRAFGTMTRGIAE
ncbi:MAG: hypothetical protein JJU29_09650 [Verrucomicrobia bacterium]|nr:hypothetical protein [Verrucomicrobiota bacterium]MCH8511544.1 hypothetical protein [Kiritimatiellia bacterium]